MRKLTASTPYRPDIFTVRQYGKYIVRITWHKSLRESGWESEQGKPRKGTVNDSKLENNLCRAKSTVRELVLCNDWDYWCTLTLSPDKQNRYDLEAFIKKFSEFIHNYNRRCIPEDKIKYLLVPEKHQDGAWHMHGFIKGIRNKDLYINQNGYLSWKQYDSKFGFISMDRIRDKEAASSYILKYMTKDTLHSVSKLNAHAFYSSKNLNRSTEVYRGSAQFKGQWDWEHPDGYCKVKNIDLRNETVENHLEFPSVGYQSEPSSPVLRQIPEFFVKSADNGFRPYFDTETGEIFPTPFDKMEFTL